MANKQTAPEAWFERRIRRGLAALMTLRMEGHPPADTVEATAKVWAQALWHGRVWVDELDSARIGESFRQITLHETRWPSPAVFLRCLPTRPQKPSLPPPGTTPDEKARARAILAVVADMLKREGVVDDARGKNRGE